MEPWWKNYIIIINANKSNYSKDKGCNDRLCFNHFGRHYQYYIFCYESWDWHHTYTQGEYYQRIITEICRWPLLLPRSDPFQMRGQIQQAHHARITGLQMGAGISFSRLGSVPRRMQKHLPHARPHVFRECVCIFFLSFFLSYFLKKKNNTTFETSEMFEMVDAFMIIKM